MCLALDLAARNKLTRTLRQAQALSDHEQVVGPDLQTVASHALLGQVGEIAEAILQQWAGPLQRQGSGSVEQSFKHSRTSEKREGERREFNYAEMLMWCRKRRSARLTEGSERKTT
jgi:hypothetical protein